MRAPAEASVSRAGIIQRGRKAAPLTSRRGAGRLNGTRAARLPGCARARDSLAPYAGGRWEKLQAPDLEAGVGYCECESFVGVNT